MCTTYHGSSGAPTLNALNFKVIGIHKGSKNDYNVGTLISKAIEEFNISNNNEKNFSLFKNSFGLKTQNSLTNEKVYGKLFLFVLNLKKKL